MRKFSASLVVAGGLLSLASANAQLAHHYNLTDGIDSVGGANGTLNGNATFANGTLTTNGDASGYLSLPSSVGTGITGDFSIETFATANSLTADYSSLFSFATAASDSNFLLFNPNRQDGSGTSARFDQGTIGNTEVGVNADGNSPLLGDGAEHDLLLTYTSGTGAVAIYNNGVLAGSGTIPAGFRFDLAAAGPNNGINGHSPFGDVSFNGSTDDFRIFSNAVTASQATALDALGANATDAQIGTTFVPEPSTWMAALVGVATLLGLQRFRRRAQA